MTRGPILLHFRLALAAFVLTNCGNGDYVEEPQPDNFPGTTSSSILFFSTEHGDRLAVVNAEDDSVSFWRRRRWKKSAALRLGKSRYNSSSPHGHILVANHGSAEIIAIDPETMQRQDDATPGCPGASGMAASPDGMFVAVACEYSGNIQLYWPERLGRAGLIADAIWPGLHRPRTVAFLGQRMIAADFVGGQAIVAPSPWPNAAPAVKVALGVASGVAAGSSDNLRAATQVYAILPRSDGAFYLAYQAVANHDSETAANAGDYGVITGKAAKVQPVLLTLAAAKGASPSVLAAWTYASHATRTRQFNAPSALLDLGDDVLAIAHLSSNDVAVVDVTSPAEARVVGSFHTGAGPRGLAFDAQKRQIYVDNSLDASVSRLDLTKSARWNASSPPRAEAAQTQLRPLGAKFSAEAWQGRRIFHDSTNTHQTPHGVIACSTCHPDGGDDGLTWFLNSGGEGKRVRRSMPLAEFRFTSPHLHWGGEFSDLATLVQSTVTQVMGGDGLMIDNHALMTYLTEMVRLPVPPTQEAATVQRGKALFEAPQTGCATCHSGPNYTDGQLHTVLKQGILPEQTPLNARTPSLRGVFLRAPYFHDGRSPNLMDLHTRADLQGHGDVTKPAPPQLQDLVAFLNSL